MTIEYFEDNDGLWVLPTYDKIDYFKDDDGLSLVLTFGKVEQTISLQKHPLICGFMAFKSVNDFEKMEYFRLHQDSLIYAVEKKLFNVANFLIKENLKRIDYEVRFSSYAEYDYDTGYYTFKYYLNKSVVDYILKTFGLDYTFELFRNVKDIDLDIIGTDLAVVSPTNRTLLGGLADRANRMRLYELNWPCSVDVLDHIKDVDELTVVLNKYPTLDFSRPNKDNKNLLHNMIITGCCTVEILELLHTKKPIHFKKMLNYTDNNGNLPLHYFRVDNKDYKINWSKGTKLGIEYLENDILGWCLNSTVFYKRYAENKQGYTIFFNPHHGNDDNNDE